MFERIINNGELSTKEAERVMGRMISFDCYVFGRIANLDLKEFGNLCRLGLTSSILDECEISVVQKCLPGWILQNLFPLESTTFRHG
jgi:hypothetical protein